MSTNMRSLIAVDVETQGLDPINNDVIEVGWAICRPNTARNEPVQVYAHAVQVHPSTVWDQRWFTNPKRKEPEGPPCALPYVLTHLLACGAIEEDEFDQRPLLVIHNAPFDMSFLACACMRRGIQNTFCRLIQEDDGPFNRRILDTQTLAMELVRVGKLRSASLDTLCEYLSVRPGNHSAGEDARATVECAALLLDHYAPLTSP